ncbi:MAG: HD domain-containing protein, partial [Lachnospiraceae bacterium]
MREAECEAYRRALDFATQKHEGQSRIGGAPYITHPVAVAEIVRQNGCPLDYQIAALFHDLLEDTDATEEELKAYGNEDILTAVRLLTKEPGYRMEHYVNRIKANPMAY